MMSSPVLKAMAGPEAADHEPTLPPLSRATALTPVAGVKRPAPSLLPAFEPLSSSPGLPRPAKRQAHGPSFPRGTAALKYPTPIPTSSTGILSSSPPRVQPSSQGRPALARSQSTASERPPLCAVPSIELNENGEMLLMGRSSNSSHYQLSANRLVSRVHVKARYIPRTSLLEPGKIEIICNGWNGVKLHCQGRTWELAKGDTFTSETENAEIMLDVQDARVRLHWPKVDRLDSAAHLSDSSWEDSPRPRHRPIGSASDLLQLSPLRRQARVQSPESPTPGIKSSQSSFGSLFSPTGGYDGQVEIFEDANVDEEDLTVTAPAMDISFAQTEIGQSFSSDLSDQEDVDPDEENDPIVHSFGPFGANLSNRLAAFATASPKQPTQEASSHSTAKPSAEPEEQPINPKIDVAAVTNHVVNQLAYSRLSSNPLSGILNNLPTEEKKDLNRRDLRKIIESTKCIGIISRTGKDAAGKALESEYYYIPEHDTDASRRMAVTDGLRKPSLRACRKQHKQYYWKRPRTP
ncbi:hypothetical protein MN608_03262 [Microdochium nivale]|nr:hypothetical protein MN608_03262 [Microdochium nivale]